MSHSSSVSCPVPHPAADRILLAHGEGGRLTRRLIRELLLPAFDNEFLRPLADGAVLPAPVGRLVITTDGSVVSPLFFPGGDIGKLAVHGAINDLAACGADPLYLSLAFVLEEGLETETLQRVVASIAEAARRCRVPIVTGDTKVVPRGTVDRMFLTTTGVGQRRASVDWGAHRVRPGDRVLVSGTLGEHGMAVLAAREGFDLIGDGLLSDTAPLHELAAGLDSCGDAVRFVRDPTRGGVAAVLQELAESADVSVVLDESALPITPAVSGACELLGLDVLHVANEGKLVVIVAPGAVETALQCLHRHPLGVNAAMIGEITKRSAAHVLVRGRLGALRVLDEPSGAPLPRIC
jgi:hydrogenase expression/formation protein HypE